MIITKTPLRISFLGGNTDFPEYYKKYGGAVLTTAIDKFIYCIVKERFDDLIYINYSKKEIVKSVDEIKHDLVRECLKLVGIKNGIEITFLSDVPSEGSGLGSSSTLTVGLLNALYQYVGKPTSYSELASQACRIEIDILKKPIGVQDQIITAYGGFRFICLEKNNVQVLPIRAKTETLSLLNENLMMFYTKKTRKSSVILKSMKIKKSIKILDKNKELAHKGMLALLHNDIPKFGGLVHEYWMLKRKLNEKVSDREIDSMYRKARKAGAFGGKFLGAGGGGFLLLIVAPDKKQKVREALKGFQEFPIRFEKCGSKVIFSL